jgi:hypothetical protein
MPTYFWDRTLGYEQKGLEKEAFEARIQGLRLESASEERIAELREAFEESGLEGVKMSPGEMSKPISRAGAYARLGDKDKAFEWLEKAWSWDLPLWGMENAPSCWRWDPLRSDPALKNSYANRSCQRKRYRGIWRCRGVERVRMFSAKAPSKSSSVSGLGLDIPFLGLSFTPSKP